MYYCSVYTGLLTLMSYPRERVAVDNEWRQGRVSPTRLSSVKVHWQ